MPPDFPTEIHRRLFPCLDKQPYENTEAQRQFTFAWHAIGYRFWALADESDVFTSSIVAAHQGDGERTRYTEERALYGFFSNAFSVFECYFYAIHAICAAVKPANISIATEAEQRAINAGSVIALLNNEFPRDRILPTLQALITNAAYVEIKLIRNVLSHRSAPGRSFFGVAHGNVPRPPQWKLGNIDLDANTTPGRRAQVVAMLSELLVAAEGFVARHVR